MNAIVRSLLLRVCRISVYAGLAVALVSCGGSDVSARRSRGADRLSGASSSSKIARWESVIGAVPVNRKVTPLQLLRETGLEQSIIPPRTAGRKIYRPMNARYITIHSTQNYSAGARQHALALRRGALTAPRRKGGNRIGYLTWHFTTEPHLVVQHLPTTEQGEHADFDGPGNNYSIGIEMCEHRGSSLAHTIDNTAKLTAYLMYAKRIPLSHVRAHYHWERKGLPTPHKNCPHFLLENGRPGATWQWFLRRVQAHYSRIVPGPAPRL